MQEKKQTKKKKREAEKKTASPSSKPPETPPGELFRKGEEELKGFQKELTPENDKQEPLKPEEPASFPSGKRIGRPPKKDKREELERLLDISSLNEAHKFLFRLIANSKYVGAQGWSPNNESVTAASFCLRGILIKRLPDKAVEYQEEVGYAVAMGAIAWSMFSYRDRLRKEEGERRAAQLKAEEGKSAK